MERIRDEYFNTHVEEKSRHSLLDSTGKSHSKPVKKHLDVCYHNNKLFFEELRSLFRKTGNFCQIFTPTTPKQDYLQWKNVVDELERERISYYRKLLSNPIQIPNR